MSVVTDIHHDYGGRHKDMYNKTLFGTVPQIPAADPPLDLTPSIRWGPCGSWQLETMSAHRTNSQDRQEEGRERMIERSRKRLVQLRTEAVTYWSSRRFEAKKGMESDVTLQKPSLQLKTCSIDFVIANSYQGATVWYLLEERNICKNINQLLSLTWSSVKTQLWLFIRFISMLMNFLFWLQGYYRFWSML